MMTQDQHKAVDAADARRITEVFEAVRRAFPQATGITVSSSDQGHGGYLLYGVLLPLGKVEEGETYDALEEEVFDELGWLSWGAFGDRDDESTFDVNLITRRIVR